MTTQTDRWTETAMEQGGASRPAFDPPSNSGFEQVRHTVADQLRRAADVVSEKAKPETYTDPRSLKGQAADWLYRSADYVDDFDPQRAKEDLSRTVRRHPGRSLLIAGAVGLVFGALMRRR